MLGFQTEYESYNLRELSHYIEAKGFSWPIRTQTILDWIGAASLRCGLPGQRMRLTHARCFLKVTLALPSRILGLRGDGGHVHHGRIGHDGKM